MNKDQKAAVVEEVAAQIKESGAVFAVDYRGISVPQVADLRVKLNDAGARFRVVKNTLTQLAADKAGAEALKGVLEGPTAFTFVRADGEVALAAKALAQFKREHNLLSFKGGLMNGEELSAEQLEALARVPTRDVLHAQLVGVIASPITGLVRGLNALIAGLAIQLKQIADEGLVPRNGAAAEVEEPAQAGPAEVEEPAQAGSAEVEEPAQAEVEEPAQGDPAEPSGEVSSPSGEAAAEEETEQADAPSGADEEKEG